MYRIARWNHFQSMKSWSRWTEICRGFSRVFLWFCIFVFGCMIGTSVCTHLSLKMFNRHNKNMPFTTHLGVLGLSKRLELFQWSDSSSVAMNFSNVRIKERKCNQFFGWFIVKVLQFSIVDSRVLIRQSCLHFPSIFWKLETRRFLVNLLVCKAGNFHAWCYFG